MSKIMYYFVANEHPEVARFLIGEVFNSPIIILKNNELILFTKTGYVSAISIKHMKNSMLIEETLFKGHELLRADNQLIYEHIERIQNQEIAIY